MTGDYLNRLEVAAGAPITQGMDGSTIPPMAVAAQVDLRAAVAELERLRAERELHIRQLRHAYRAGWDERGEDIEGRLHQGGFARAEQRAKDYADHQRRSSADPQQLEHKGSEDPS